MFATPILTGVRVAALFPSQIKLNALFRIHGNNQLASGMPQMTSSCRASVFPAEPPLHRGYGNVWALVGECSSGCGLAKIWESRFFDTNSHYKVRSSGPKSHCSRAGLLHREPVGIEP